MIYLLNFIYNFLRFVFIFWIAASWIRELQKVPYYDKLDNLMQRILKPIRDIIPPIGGQLDLSPLILFMAIQLLYGFLINFVR